MEAVDSDDERQPRGFEVVDRREGVREPPGIHQDDRSDRAVDQVIRHKPEPVLAGSTEQVVGSARRRG